MRRVFRRLNINEREKTLGEFSTVRTTNELFNYLANDKRIPLEGARLKGDGEVTKPVALATRYSPEYRVESYRDTMEADRPPT